MEASSEFPVKFFYGLGIALCWGVLLLYGIKALHDFLQASDRLAPRSDGTTQKPPGDEQSSSGRENRTLEPETSKGVWHRRRAREYEAPSEVGINTGDRNNDFAEVSSAIMPRRAQPDSGSSQVDHDQPIRIILSPEVIERLSNHQTILGTTFPAHSNDNGSEEQYEIQRATSLRQRPPSPGSYTEGGPSSLVQWMMYREAQREVQEAQAARRKSAAKKA
ncbi:hypothetical protein SCUP234_00775 [Seiridium cupressi]